MKRLSILFLMIMLPCVIAHTQGLPDNSHLSRSERDLIKLNQEYDAALVRGDADALDRLYADEFVYTTPDGEVRKKSEQLGFTRSGALRLDSGKSDDVRIRIYGNTAVMTGRFTASGKFRGKDLSILERYTAVWVKRKGRWQIVAEQGNLAKPQTH